MTDSTPRDTPESPEDPLFVGFSGVGSSRTSDEPPEDPQTEDEPMPLLGAMGQYPFAYPLDPLPEEDDTTK